MYVRRIWCPLLYVRDETYDYEVHCTTYVLVMYTYFILDFTTRIYYPSIRILLHNLSLHTRTVHVRTHSFVINDTRYDVRTVHIRRIYGDFLTGQEYDDNVRVAVVIA